MAKVSWHDLSFLTLYTLIIGVVFFYILYTYVPSDIGAHTQILLRFLEMGSFPTPPLYYALVYGLHFIMPYKEGFGMAAWVILTGAGFFKYLWSLNYLKYYCPQVSGRYVNLFVFGLMFFAPITLFGYEGEYWYLGKFTSVVWHNSTTLLSFPFCILLFRYSIKFFEDREMKMLGKIFLVGIVIILIKPSFIFAFLPSFLVMVLFLEKHFSKVVIICLVGAIALVLFILVEKFVIYDQGKLDEVYFESTGSGIGIDPFFVWLSWTEYPIIDLFTSLLFPITFVCIYFKLLIKDVHFWFSTLMVLFALIIFFFIIETGPRILDGNFYWQIILTLFICYLVLIKIFIRIIRLKGAFKDVAGLSITNIVLLILFIFHVVSGFAYLLRIVFSKNFL